MAHDIIVLVILVNICTFESFILLLDHGRTCDLFQMRRGCPPMRRALHARRQERMHEEMYEGLSSVSIPPDTRIYIYIRSRSMVTETTCVLPLYMPVERKVLDIHT
jgi:hypothetical protein